MGNSKVAIITIYYNRENNIAQSVRSLLDQTYKHCHLYIVDDHSSDNTFGQLCDITKNNDNVTLIQNKINKGFTKSLIDTIKNIHEPYIAISGASDISLPARIDEQVHFLDTHSDVGVVSVGVENRPVNNISNEIMEITTKDLLKRNMVNHGTVMFRLNLYRKVGGYRPFFKFRQDKDLWYRMSLVTKLYFLPQKLYRWTNVDNALSQSHGPSPEATLLSIFATKLMKERLKFGHDSLDTYGGHAALMFNPTHANRLFFKNVMRLCFQKEFGHALLQLQFLIDINKNKVVIAFCVLLKRIISIFYVKN